MNSLNFLAVIFYFYRRRITQRSLFCNEFKEILKTIMSLPLGLFERKKRLAAENLHYFPNYFCYDRKYRKIYFKFTF